MAIARHKMAPTKNPTLKASDFEQAPDQRQISCRV
jgi:hypothetical protein